MCPRQRTPTINKAWRALYSHGGLQFLKGDNLGPFTMRCYGELTGNRIERHKAEESELLPSSRFGIGGNHDFQAPPRRWKPEARRLKLPRTLARKLAGKRPGKLARESEARSGKLQGNSSGNIHRKHGEDTWHARGQGEYKECPQ